LNNTGDQSWQALSSGVIDFKMNGEQIRKILSVHDLVYEKPALEWEKHIPLGNGFMGGALWGANPLYITLDRYDVWETRSSAQIDKDKYNFETLKRLVKEGKSEEVYQIFEPDSYSLSNHIEDYIFPTKLPMGKAKIEFNSSVKEFRAKLRLYDAAIVGKLALENGGAVKFKIYLHAKRNIIVADLKLEHGAKLVSFCAQPVRDKKTCTILKGWGYPEPEAGVFKDMAYWKQPLPSGGDYLVMWRHLDEGNAKRNKYKGSVESDRSAHITLFATVASSNETPDTMDHAYRTLLSAQEAGIHTLWAEHASFWNRYWNKSFITVPDPRLESLYYCEMYKLGAAVRPDGWPISLQGLWTQDDTLPPWSGDYHFDLNVMQSYWAIYSSNRLELGESLYTMLLRMMPKLERDCREFYGCDGAMLQCAVTYDGKPILGWHTANLWAGNGAWISHLFWLHYLYSQDKQFLKECAYPVMRKFMNLYEHLLQKDEKSIYHLPFSYSPEWKGNSLEAWGEDCSGDLSLVKYLCAALLKSIEILHIEDEKVEKWKDILAHLAPYPTHLDWLGEGISVQKNMPLIESHRHHTHLMGIYPLEVLNIEQDENEKLLIEATFRQWCQKGKGEWVGWSYPWASCIYSRVGYRNAAWHCLREYMDGFIMENTQHINGDPKYFGMSVYNYRPMTVEGGLSVIPAVNEMLLQSWGGIIRLFPSIPDIWFDVSFKDLRAEGAFVVSSCMVDRKVQYVKITSEAGCVCRVKNPFAYDKCLLVEGGSRYSRELAGDILEFSTHYGETYFLVPCGDDLDTIAALDFNLLKRDFKDYQPFGIKIRPSFL
jgi:alpha-L-fucosidase 2